VLKKREEEERESVDDDWVAMMTNQKMRGKGVLFDVSLGYGNIT
jgi:hypothetical protein